MKLPRQDAYCSTLYDLAQNEDEELFRDLFEAMLAEAFGCGVISAHDPVTVDEFLNAELDPYEAGQTLRGITMALRGEA